MWEPLILSTSPRKATARVALFCAVFSLSSGCMAEGTLTAEDLKNPGKLLTHRQNATHQDRQLAQKMYQHALQATKKDSASAVKSFSESALIYPTSSALAGLAEYRAKMLAKKDGTVKRAALSEIIQYLNSAERLNAADKMLAKDELSLVIQDKACTEQFLANKPSNDACRPVQWIGLR